MQFPVLVYQDEDGIFIGEVPTLRGVHSHGKTLVELHKNLKEAIELYLEVQKEKLPDTTQYSFQIIHINAKTKNRSSQKNYQVA